MVAFDPVIHHVRRLERDARRLEDLVSMSAELEDADLIVDLHGSMRVAPADLSAEGSGAARAVLSCWPARRWCTRAGSDARRRLPRWPAMPRRWRRSASRWRARRA